MSTRNQISGSITFDVASLADAIATRLQQPAPGPVPLAPRVAATQLSDALASETGAESYSTAHRLIEYLAVRGITLVQDIPPPSVDQSNASEMQDWFSRRNDS